MGLVSGEEKILRRARQGADSRVHAEKPRTFDELEENADDLDEWQVGKKFKYDLADLRLEDWLKHLKNDKEALIDLYNNAVSVTPERDAKLAELKKIIAAKVGNPFNANNSLSISGRQKTLITISISKSGSKRAWRLWM